MATIYRSPTNRIKHGFWAVRRALLKALVPELIWPVKVLLNDVEVPVRGQPWSFGVKRSIVRHTYEINERNLICPELNGHTNVIEFGASIGILTRIIAEKIQPHGRIVSVEADASLAESARRLLKGTNNATVIAGFAFPVFELTHHLSVTAFDTTGGSLGGKIAYEIDPDAQATAKQPIIDIKWIIQRFDLEPHVLVCDVEGAENIILNEQARLPASLATILIETHPSIYGSEVERDILDRLKSERYKLENRSSDVYLLKRA